MLACLNVHWSRDTCMLTNQKHQNMTFNHFLRNCYFLDVGQRIYCSFVSFRGKALESGFGSKGVWIQLIITLLLRDTAYENTHLLANLWSDLQCQNTVHIFFVSSSGSRPSPTSSFSSMHLLLWEDAMIKMLIHCGHSGKTQPRLCNYFI